MCYPCGYEHVCLCYYMCVFSVLFLGSFSFFFLCFISIYLFLFYIIIHYYPFNDYFLFSKKRESEWIRMGHEVERKGVGRRENIIRIYCMKKKLLKKRKHVHVYPMLLLILTTFFLLHRESHTFTCLEFYCGGPNQDQEYVFCFSQCFFLVRIINFRIFKA